MMVEVIQDVNDFAKTLGKTCHILNDSVVTFWRAIGPQSHKEVLVVGYRLHGQLQRVGIHEGVLREEIILGNVAISTPLLLLCVDQTTY